MYTFTCPGSYYIYNVRVYWSWKLLFMQCTCLLALVVSICTMYAFTGPGYYCIQCTRLIALVVTIYTMYAFIGPGS